MKTLKMSALALLLSWAASCSKEIPAPQSLIPLEKAKQQLEYYNAAHPQEVGSEYAVRTWISIDELKSYIAYIETESKAKGIEVSGIDMIHTQYNKAIPGSPNPNNSVYNLTLMLAPTYKKGNSNVAFDPIYSEPGKPKDLKDLLEKIKIDSLDGSAPSPGNSSIANGLNTCPNKCN